MDLQLTSASKRGYTVSPSSTQIIVYVIANCQMSVNPYFQYNMLTKNFLFTAVTVTLLDLVTLANSTVTAE